MSKKPKLQPGEYGPGVALVYENVQHPEWNGTYTVELGAERRHPRYRWTERLVRVSGEAFAMYAMVREGGNRAGKICRDESILRQRAVSWYVNKFVRPKAEAEEEARQSREYASALRSSDNWVISEGGRGIGVLSIEPIGIRCELCDTQEHVDRKREIMQRLLALAKEHGV